LETTSACAGHGGCNAWQQFLYATDGQGDASVFMQYWLLGWGSSCPRGWNQDGKNCWKDSDAVAAPDVPITDLGKCKASTFSDIFLIFPYIKFTESN
jgi:hypothetical protein